MSNRPAVRFARSCSVTIGKFPRRQQPSDREFLTNALVTIGIVRTDRILITIGIVGRDPASSASFQQRGGNGYPQSHVDSDNE
ncbi:MAG TPA: hypothetical protein DDZ51_11265 [Planctomycetaceae bacterium]|nr:hypothetical protein [Planctomycetaceae bacterium]